MSRRDDLLQSWLREEQQPFVGWDFSYLQGRMVEEPLPWDYLARASELMRNAHSLLDLDTGGGEKLLQMAADWPARVVAIEEYPPNFKLASERLAPLGVEMWPTPITDDALLPFADAEFDLVLNRHAPFNSAEVARVLAPGGVFLTQQVHGLWAWDLLAAFDAKPQWPDSTPEKYVPRLTAAGLAVVDVRNWQGKLRFSDVGAIAYNLKVVPWLAPGFTVATHQRYLFALQDRLDRGEELAFEARMYLIEAHKAA